MLELQISSAPAQDELPFPSAPRAWWAVAVLLLLAALSFLDRQVLFLMVDRIKPALKITDFQFSLLQGFAFALFYTVFGLPFGWAVDRFSRRWIIFVGVTIWSLAASACGLAQTFWQLAFARFGVGIGEAALSPAAFSLLSDTFPKKRLTMAIAVFAIGGLIGSAASLAIGGLFVELLPKHGASLPIVGHLANWQLVFVLTGLPCLATSWLVFTIADPVRRGRLSASPTTIPDALRFMGGHWRFYAGHFAGFGLISLIGYAGFAWVPSYLHRVFGWNMIAIASIMAICTGGGSIIGGFSQGVIVQRWFRAGRQDAHLRFFIFVAMAQSVLLLIGVAAHNPYVFLVFLTISTLGSSSTGVSASALQLVTPNEFRGQVSALYLLVFNLLGIGLGPSIPAALTVYVFKNDHMVGWSIVLTYLVLAPLAALCFASAERPMREMQAAAEPSLAA